MFRRVETALVGFTLFFTTLLLAEVPSIPTAPVDGRAVKTADELADIWNTNTKKLGQYEVQFNETTIGHLKSVGEHKSQWANVVDEVTGLYTWREGKDLAFKVAPVGDMSRFSPKWVGDARLDHEASFDGEDKYVDRNKVNALIEKIAWKPNLSYRQIFFVSRSPYALFFPVDGHGPAGTGKKQTYSKEYVFKGEKHKASMVEPYKLFVSDALEMRDGVAVLRVEDWQGSWNEDGGAFTPDRCVAIYFADPAMGWLPREAVYFRYPDAPFRWTKVTSVTTLPNGAIYPKTGVMVQYVRKHASDERIEVSAPPEVLAGNGVPQFTRTFAVNSLAHGKSFTAKDLAVNIDGKDRMFVTSKGSKMFTADSSLEDILEGRGKEKPEPSTKVK